MITSGRALRATSGLISGSGLAMAKMIGLSLMEATISGVNASLTEHPSNMSAPSIASASVRALVSAACLCFHSFIPASRPL